MHDRGLATPQTQTIVIGGRAVARRPAVRWVLRLVLCGPAFAAAGTADRPGVIVILTDDQRYDELGITGHPVIETPQIDALRQRCTELQREALGRGPSFLRPRATNGNATPLAITTICAHRAGMWMFDSGSRARRPCHGERDRWIVS